jgi:hypothetical protein
MQEGIAAAEKRFLPLPHGHGSEKTGVEPRARVSGNEKAFFSTPPGAGAKHIRIAAMIGYLRTFIFTVLDSTAPLPRWSGITRRTFTE